MVELAPLQGEPWEVWVRLGGLPVRIRDSGFLGMPGTDPLELREEMINGSTKSNPRTK